MKKRLLYLLATAAMLFATVGYYAPATDGGDPVPKCNPLTDPNCRP